MVSPTKHSTLCRPSPPHDVTPFLPRRPATASAAVASRPLLAAGSAPKPRIGLATTTSPCAPNEGPPALIDYAAQRPCDSAAHLRPRRAYDSLKTPRSAPCARGPNRGRNPTPAAGAFARRQRPFAPTAAPPRSTCASAFAWRRRSAAVWSTASSPATARIVRPRAASRRASATPSPCSRPRLRRREGRRRKVAIENHSGDMHSGNAASSSRPPARISSAATSTPATPRTLETRWTCSVTLGPSRSLQPARRHGWEPDGAAVQ